MNGNIVLFEDNRVDRLEPVTTVRPAFGVTCAAWNLHEIACLAHCSISHIVRKRVEETCQMDFPDVSDGPGPWLFLNASVVPDVDYVRQIRELLLQDRPRIYLNKDRVAAVVVPADTQLPAGLTHGTVSDRLRERKFPRCDEIRFRMLDRPDDIITLNSSLFAANIKRRIVQTDHTEIREGVFAPADATIARTAVFDTEDGPVLIGRNSRVGELTYIRGPAYLASGSTVRPHASLNGCVSVGSNSIVGGEVEACVIEPDVLKRHHGFFANSYLGNWTEIGAGTNCDPKQGDRERSDNTDKPDTSTIGCVLGDHTRTAANTSLAAGTHTGVASHPAGYVEHDIAAFRSCDPRTGECTARPIEKVLAGRCNGKRREEEEYHASHGAILRKAKRAAE